MASREGPTILWTMLKGKKVKSNDGKDVGEIKEVSQNFLRLEKGILKKHSSLRPMDKRLHTILILIKTLEYSKNTKMFEI